MSHLPFTLAAYFFNSLSTLIDKFLLQEAIPDPLVYIFYLSIFSLVSLILIPFVPIPTLFTFILASLSTLLWTSGAYFMFKALQKGVASRVIPLIGTLIPLILIAYYKSFGQISLNQTWAALFLTLGLLVLVLPYLKGKLVFYELSLELLASVFFAISYIILRSAYTQAPFLTIFAWSGLILIPLGVKINLDQAKIVKKGA